MVKIVLEGMEFHGYHGVHEEEKRLGGKYLVDLEIEASVKKSLSSDELKDTIDYEALYNMVVEEMENPCQLLEHLARNILTRVIGSDSRIKRGKIRIKKLNPPMKGIIRSAFVEWQKAREK